jgi:ABC-type taurine transport system ATPase subunit
MHLKLYGQDSVLASIHRMLDSLQDERDSVMLVEGAPGSGKTHLLDVTAGEARQRGVPTARITPEALPLCPPEGPARPRLILVDDAHEISAETLW